MDYAFAAEGDARVNVATVQRCAELTQGAALSHASNVYIALVRNRVENLPLKTCFSIACF